MLHEALAGAAAGELVLPRAGINGGLGVHRPTTAKKERHTRRTGPGASFRAPGFLEVSQAALSVVDGRQTTWKPSNSAQVLEVVENPISERPWSLIQPSLSPKEEV